MVYCWYIEKHTYVDRTGVSPLSGFGNGVFIKAVSKISEVLVFLNKNLKFDKLKSHEKFTIIKLILN